MAGAGRHAKNRTRDPDNTAIPGNEEERPGLRSRRDFLRGLAGSATVFALGPALPALLAGCHDDPTSSEGPSDDDLRNALRLLDAIAPRDITLRAASGTADIGGGVTATSWMLNGNVPSPLLRARQGDPFRVTLQNDLAEDLILHWHGLTPPELMDGHPRLAVGPGESYDYAFTVENRAGTYWYHSHAHMRVAEHTYRGIAGLLIVDDAEEEALGLPRGAREIPLILQDRRVDAAGVPYYQPVGPDMMFGYLGDEVFANGIRRAYLDVDTALYRFRILNGSNARIFRIGRSDGAPLVLIGSDDGLLSAPQSLPSVDVAPAERVDLLVDLRDASVGARVMLRSLPFSIPGAGGFPGGAGRQGQALNLLELRVQRRVADDTAIPGTLPTVPAPNPSAATRTRDFRFQSQMMDHRINGLRFDIGRIDQRVPFGDTEIWRFVNESNVPHPVHLHATHFRVLSRTGGRAQVLPWETGPKDTVLLYPNESVEVVVRFDAHPGLFLLHCHNLEHEDMGMMANILVE